MELITITEAARNHFVNMMTRANEPCLTLRLKPSGCNGFSYHYESKAPEGESLHFVLSNGKRVFGFFIDAKSVPFMLGTTIDYVRDGLAYKLVYDNPQAKGSCGCGESFNF